MFVKFFILSWGVTISTFSVIFDWKFLSIFTVMGTFMIIYALIAFWPNLDDLKWELARFLMQLSHNVQCIYLSKAKKTRFLSGCESARPEIHPGQEFRRNITRRVQLDLR
jgi:hypothetical protein